MLGIGLGKFGPFDRRRSRGHDAATDPLAELNEHLTGDEAGALQRPRSSGSRARGESEAISLPRPDQLGHEIRVVNHAIRLSLRRTFGTSLSFTDRRYTGWLAATAIETIPPAECRRLPLLSPQLLLS